MAQKLYILICLALFASCATQSRKDQSQTRELYAQGQFDQALSFLDSSEIKKDSNNSLLYQMEKGRILFSQGRYYSAINVFEKANRLIDKLYTKSIRKEIASSLLSDNSKSYYGSVFERSLIYYHLAFSYYHISMQGYYTMYKGGKSKRVDLDSSKKSNFIYKARASIVAWDVFVKEIQRSSRIKTIYQHDLLGRVLGGQIHEAIGKKKETRISINLYKQSLKILNNQGKSYKSYNKLFKKYVKNFGKSKNGPFSKTAHYDDLKSYLHYKILSLTKKHQNYRLKSLVKSLKPSPLVLDKIKKPVANVSIILEKNVIEPTVGLDFTYNLRTAIDAIKDPGTKALVRGVGVPILTHFAMGPLGLGGVSRSGNTYVYHRHNIGTTLVKEVGIGFEMPYVAPRDLEQSYTIKVVDNKGNVVATDLMALTGPLSDIAHQAANERASNSFVKVGTRVAIKHIVAILAAYSTYKTMSDKGQGAFAQFAAMAQYSLSSKGIAVSEVADTRHWGTLPSNVFMSDLYLPPGEYKVELYSSKNKISTLGSIKVGKKKSLHRFFSK